MEEICSSHSRTPISVFLRQCRTKIPPVDAIFSNRDGHHMLSIFVSGVTINCHFLFSEEIELDIDPREVKGQFEHEAVLEFFRVNF